MAGLPFYAVFFTGFMGSGKSTAGSALAGRLGWRFVDLDAEIVAAAGKSIPEIFAGEGEDRFRDIETRILQRVISDASVTAPAVVALGGGTLLRPDNRETINATGQPLVFLEADVETLWKRCSTGVGQRPLAQDRNQFQQLYAARFSHYTAASIRVQTAGHDPDNVAELIERLLRMKEVS